MRFMPHPPGLLFMSCIRQERLFHKLWNDLSAVEKDYATTCCTIDPMRFTVVPGDGTATRAFIRVKVK